MRWVVDRLLQVWVVLLHRGGGGRMTEEVSSTFVQLHRGGGGKMTEEVSSTFALDYQH